MRSILIATTVTPAARSCASAERLSSLAYSTTRSGWRARTASTLGRSPGPTSVIDRAASGYVSHVVRPTTRPPAPMAKRSSVVAGLSETMRAGCDTVPAGTRAPKSSASSRAAAPSEWRQAATESARSEAAARRENKTGILQFGAMPGARANGAGSRGHQPLLRGTEIVARTRGVSWLRASRPPSQPGWPVAWWTRSIARYSGGTAPDSHRLPGPASAIQL